jgi:MoxR-like ATPase
LTSPPRTEPAQALRRVAEHVQELVVGMSDETRILQMALLSRGHVLIEGPPGTAKTTLAKLFSRLHGGTFRRVQCTPDMLPADVTGFYLYQLDGASRFVEGPVFANFVLLDELNRTSVRTQSALLEAMSEGQVTVDGRTHRLSPPFMVIASQVPEGREGTVGLADVQADRFMLRITTSYLSGEAERAMLRAAERIEEAEVAPVVDLAEVQQFQREVSRVHVADAVLAYITDLVEALRSYPEVAYGPGHRATIALHRAGRAGAYLDGRDFVLPDDVKGVASAALEHRVWLRGEAEADGVLASSLVERALTDTAVPR